MNNDIAGIAITSRKLAELLARHLAELPDDVGRLAQRTAIDIVLDAANVTSVETLGRWRTFTFRDGLIVEERVVPWPFDGMYNASTRFELEPDDGDAELEAPIGRTSRPRSR